MSDSTRSSAQASSPTVNEPCDICQSRAFEPICTQDRHGGVLHTGLCMRCGLVRHMQVPSEAELAAFYAHDYRLQYHGERRPSARRVLRAWRNGQRIYRQLASYVSPGDAVFEIGAGIGATLKAFELHGHRAAGIEPGESFCEYSQQQLRVKVQKADLQSLAREPQHDLVLLVHVIEHLRSPRLALEQIGDMLHDRGRLYVECPNLGAPFGRPGKLFHFAHIHNFTPTTLQMLARRSGFEVERVFSSPSDPNLQMLLRKAAVRPTTLDVDPRSVEQTLAVLGRYNQLTYHLRADYLLRRMQKTAAYLAEHLAAGPLVHRLEKRCQKEATRGAA